MRIRRGRIASFVALALFSSGLFLAMEVTPAYAAPPTVSSVNDSSGPLEGGETIQITGSGFWVLGTCAALTTVTFGYRMVPVAGSPPDWEPVRSSSVSIVSNTRIDAVVPPNGAGTVSVVVANVCGTSGTGVTYTYADPTIAPCNSSCNVTINNTADGSAEPVANGLLLGTLHDDTDIGTYLDTIDDLITWTPLYWRVGGVFYPDEAVENRYDAADHFGSQIIYNITDDWRGGEHWPDLPTQHILDDGWYDFVYQLVLDMQDAGKPVDYWDVYNEPGGGNSTAAQWVNVYKDAYDAIHAAEDYIQANIDAGYPTQKLIGPSTHFDVTAQNCCLDLATFISETRTAGKIYDAIAWHEFDNNFPTAAARLDHPKFVAEHIATVRSLLTGGYSGKEIFIPEYLIEGLDQMPGWSAGFVNYLEYGDVDSAGRSCWQPYCDEGLDGLLTTGADPDPQAPYWVYKFYSEMEGTRLTWSTAATDISAFATKHDGSSTVKVLLGRHHNCARIPMQYSGGADQGTSCDDTSPVGADDVVVEVPVPSGWSLSTVDIVVQQIPNTVPLATLPSATTYNNVTVTSNKVTVTIEDFADREAYTITVSP